MSGQAFDPKNSVAAYWREWQGTRVLVLNNLADSPVSGIIAGGAEGYRDLLSGEKVLPGRYDLPPYGFVWLKEE